VHLCDCSKLWNQSAQLKCAKQPKRMSCRADQGDGVRWVLMVSSLGTDYTKKGGADDSRRKVSCALKKHQGDQKQEGKTELTQRNFF